MKKNLAFATLCVFAFIGFISAINFGKQYVVTTAQAASAGTAPPFVGETWKEADTVKFASIASSQVKYVEMQHGWLVYHGQGLAFVPKPR